jgi:hypothetical protein
MVPRRSHLSREALQALFARAAARRADRRVFVQTLRTILRERLIDTSQLLQRLDSRLIPREA